MSNKWKQNQGKANGNAQKGGAAAAGRQQEAGMIPAYPRQADGEKKKKKKAVRQEAASPVAVQVSEPVQQSVPVRPTPQGEPVQPVEPQKKATQPKPQPVQKASAGQPKAQEAQDSPWESKVDDCLAQLTQLTKDHHKTLDDHERRIRKLEQWKEKDGVFAKKVTPVIAELQRDKELSDERMAELENQFWSIWAHHLGLEEAEDPMPEPEPEPNSESVPEPELKSEPDPKPAPEVSEPAVVPVSACVTSDSTCKNGPVLIYKYRFWIGEDSYYGLTSDYWAAVQASNGNFWAVWAWYKDDEIDHIMSGEEIHKYKL